MKTPVLVSVTASKYDYIMHLVGNTIVSRGERLVEGKVNSNPNPLLTMETHIEILKEAKIVFP